MTMRVQSSSSAPRSTSSQGPDATSNTTPTQAAMIQLVNWSKTPLSPDYRGAGSFATFMIIGATCFFLGILFASFPYDFPLLWTASPVPDSYYDILETHLRWMHQSPPLISRVLNIITTVGLLGFLIKLYRPAVLNFLFDGASLILYIIGCLIYVRSIVRRLRLVSWGTWPAEDEDGGSVSRKDNVKLLAMSNTILALVLVGVLVLQVGQWYAEGKEIQDLKEDAQAHALERRSSGSKKKQT